MEHDLSWEEETRSLIVDAYEERQKLEQRRLSLERSIASQDQKIAALELALETYRIKYGLAKIDALAVPVEISKEYQGLGIKDMLNSWAEKHGGDVVLKDASRYLARIGIFVNERQAYGSLYSAIGRMPEFSKMKPGVYRWQRQPTPLVTPADHGVTHTHEAMDAYRHYTNAGMDTTLPIAEEESAESAEQLNGNTAEAPDFAYASR